MSYVKGVIICLTFIYSCKAMAIEKIWHVMPLFYYVHPTNILAKCICLLKSWKVRPEVTVFPLTALSTRHFHLLFSKGHLTSFVQPQFFALSLFRCYSGAWGSWRRCNYWLSIALRYRLSHKHVCVREREVMEISQTDILLCLFSGMEKNLRRRNLISGKIKH